MKKCLLMGGLFMASLLGKAQTDAQSPVSDRERWTSKRGVYMFPEKGEWALGFSATSVFSYASSLFTGSNPSPVFDYPNMPSVSVINGFSPAVMGKYMIKENQAIRVRFQAGINTFHNTFSVQKAVVTPDPFVPELVEDKIKNTNSALLVSGGYEWRKGKGRIKAVYGGEVLVGTFGAKTEVTYGNAMSAAFPAPPTFQGPLSVRPLRMENSGHWYFGARGFAGIEYFFAPKISLGGEFGYNLGYSTPGKVESEFEVFDTNRQELRKFTIKNTGFFNNPGFTLGLDNFTAGLNFCFYF